MPGEKFNFILQENSSNSGSDISSILIAKDKNYVWRPSLLCYRSDSMEQSASLASFKRTLKTYLFNISF